MGQPKEATPHHLIFLADPQLIDPHSYPGRPWPISTLTILHTDNYLKRSYKQLQKKLHPDTIFFLGDLFDGGREWKTAHGNTQDPSWANGQRPSGEAAYAKTWGERYGEDFWLAEYNRFGSIFFKFWNLGGDKAGPAQRGRRVISSLPGNHDLGFGSLIQVPIRDRFEAFFGDTNRVDVIGNHTFVSIDAVSLSAPATDRETFEIRAPVEAFLSKVQSSKRKAVARELRYQAGEEENIQHAHVIEELDSADFSHLPTLDPGPGTTDLPTILLTHVPLYRAIGTSCGPFREHWPPATPPAGQTDPVFPDERNAISISGGYQYQNVLSEEDSVRLVSDIGNVVSVFSGDDHDYCELIHPDNKNRAREITVKAISYAMGVRKPGFLLLSMWNPIAADGSPLHSTPTSPGAAGAYAQTMESHLCLLPDQLGILIRYAIFIVFSIFLLTIRSILVPILNLAPFSQTRHNTSSSLATSLLPHTNRDIKRQPSLKGKEKESDLDHHSSASTSSTSSTSSTTNNPISTHTSNKLAPRTSRPANSPSPSYGYGIPSSNSSSSLPPPSLPDIEGGGRRRGRKSSQDYGLDNGRRTGDTVGKLVWREVWTSIWRVMWVVVAVFLYLSVWG